MNYSVISIVINIAVMSCLFLRGRLYRQIQCKYLENPDVRFDLYLCYFFNADERSRTSTGQSPQAPEACASANSATSAAVSESVGLKFLSPIL